MTLVQRLSGSALERAKHVFVWLSRVHRCRGFGIQSPTDYRFVRYVVNEHWPYYAYETLGRSDPWLQRKLGLLYFRLANWRQPEKVFDAVGALSYLQAGCRKAQAASHAEPVELAIAPLTAENMQLLSLTGNRSVLVFQDIKRQPALWQQVLDSKTVTISFDLYYCGILLFDKKRARQHYIINF